MSSGVSRLQIVADVVAVGGAIAAVIISLLALQSSNEATAGTARAEIAAYANEMVRLDREADERNLTQITVLAEQADAVIDSFGQDRLHLAPATYRVLAQYTTLVTDNRSLAKEFGDEAVAFAQQQGNTLEEIRARRALADLAAKDGDITEMRNQVDTALELANPDPHAIGAKVLRNSKDFTGAFAVYSALWATVNGGAGPAGCDAAREYFAMFRKTIARQAASRSLEVSRRAYRLGTNPNAAALCGLHPQDDLHLRKFATVWSNNPDRKK